MIYDNLLLIESPIQILIVLTIALLVFGPKKLPEIGRQIGGALRELRKAAGDVTRSFTTDLEPDTSSSYSGYNSYDRNASYYSPPPAVDAPLDLSDYTIVGVTVPETEPSASSNVESAQGTGRLDDLADYTLVGSWAGVSRTETPSGPYIADHVEPAPIGDGQSGTSTGAQQSDPATDAEAVGHGEKE